MLFLQTPHWKNPINDRNIKFRVVLHLPTASPGAPLKINQLFSDMPRFSHSLPNMVDTAYFELINLKSENALIYVDVGISCARRLRTWRA